MSAPANPGSDGPMVVDLHAHPSLKTTLWRRNFAKRHRWGGLWNPLAMRVDLPKLREGGVRVLVSAVYLPEQGLLDECAILRAVKRLAPRRIRDLFGPGPFAQTLCLIAQFEQQVQHATIDGRQVACVAHGRAELDAALSAGQIAILHAVEGAHSLDGDVANVHTLFGLGVCLITIAHFFENEFVAPVQGIPEAQRPPCCYRRPKDPSRGLTAKGQALVQEMVELGIIIDLSHCTPVARKSVFQIVGNRRPLVFSHVGVRALCNDPMNPDDDEIAAVAATGGVIGIICMNSLLTDKPRKNGLDDIVATARYIRDKGGIKSVAIGTDFDGFTDPPDDVKDPADLPDLADALAAGGFTSPDIDAILHTNALRVLHDGWGRP